MPAAKPPHQRRKKLSSRLDPLTYNIIKSVARRLGDGDGRALDTIVQEWLEFKENEREDA
jgi:hypothetical protein